jgi:phosphinothricin acetyltransferase
MAAKVSFKIRKATPTDAADVADIYNQGIDGRAATFVTTHFSAVDMQQKIEDGKTMYPLLVAESERKKPSIIGWGSISAYSPRACYDGVGEVSIYVRKGFERQGVGQALAEALCAEATRLGYWKLMARIFVFNKASIALFRKIGYVNAGLHKDHGKLDGKWLDVLEVERSIPSNLK